MYRPRLIFGCREDCSADHLAQHALRHGHGVCGIDLGQIGIVVGIHGSDLEGRSAAADKDAQRLVHRDADLLVGQLADDIEEQSCGHNAGAGLVDLGADVHGNARFQIEAGEQHACSGAHQNALEAGDRALLRDGTRGQRDRAGQHGFFTGELHLLPHFLYLSKDRKDNL